VLSQISIPLQVERQQLKLYMPTDVPWHLLGRISNEDLAHRSVGQSQRGSTYCRVKRRSKQGLGGIRYMGGIPQRT
jgi:hypothetical protein